MTCLPCGIIGRRQAKKSSTRFVNTGSRRRLVTRGRNTLRTRARSLRYPWGWIDQGDAISWSKSRRLRVCPRGSARVNDGPREFLYTRIDTVYALYMLWYVVRVRLNVIRWNFGDEKLQRRIIPMMGLGRTLWINCRFYVSQISICMKFIKRVDFSQIFDLRINIITTILGNIFKFLAKYRNAAARWFMK